jgi:hypothetical protein
MLVKVLVIRGEENDFELSHFMGMHAWLGVVYDGPLQKLGLSFAMFMNNLRRSSVYRLSETRHQFMSLEGSMTPNQKRLFYWTFANSEATEPRNMVYGALGVFSANNKVDYDTSIADVYCKWS